jgi:hypothetical protein
VRWFALGLAALALSGCQSTAEKSAELEKYHRVSGSTAGLAIDHTSAIVKIAATAILHGSEGTAAVVTLRNGSGATQTAVPLAITARSTSGATLYTNTESGQERSLTTVAIIPPHGEATWVDDQIQTPETPASLTAKAGEGTPLTGATPLISVTAGPIVEEGAGPEAKGTVTNHSSVAQTQLVVYAVATRGRRIVAAGRAVISLLGAGASAPFKALMIGSSTGGARLALTAPATVLH